MNDIIKKLGISKGSVYWHFKSKEEIFVQVITDSYDQWLGLVDRELANIDDPIEKIRKYSELFITTVEIPVWRISPETYWNEFDSRNTILLDTLFAKDDILLQGIFEDAINQGRLKYTDPAQAGKITWIIISSLEGMFEKVILSYKKMAATASSAEKGSLSYKKYEAEFEQHKKYAIEATNLFLESMLK